MTDASAYPQEDELAERIIELRIPSRLGYERVAMDAASSIARRMGFQSERIDALRTAIAEAVTNAIEHGNNQTEDMKVLVMLTIRSDELVVRITDQGQQLLDQSKAELQPRIEDRFQKADKGGWGIWLMRELMDEVEFSIAPDGSNHVRMVIHLEK